LPRTNKTTGKITTKTIKTTVRNEELNRDGRKKRMK